MPGLLPHPDPDGLLEYSVVYTDRSLNHMSKRFCGVMMDISRIVKSVYRAHAAVIVPGSGTFGMEAVARQFAAHQNCLILRNGWFSFRWSQILEMGQIASGIRVLTAQRSVAAPQAPFAPAPIDEVIQAIKTERPAVVFAPHVETSAGIILPDEYLRTVGSAVREVGGLCILDCIASGTIWVDMQANNVDVLISAPQRDGPVRHAAGSSRSASGHGLASSKRRARALPVICGSGSRSWNPTKGWLCVSRHDADRFFGSAAGCDARDRAVWICQGV